MTLTVGHPAPTFTLPSSDGGTLALEDLRGTNVVLYFYPKDNTPGCTIEAQDFRDAVPDLRALGAAVLGVSKDSIASHCKFRDKYNLNFPLLTDADGIVLEAYGAWGDKMMYGKPVTGVIRSTVLIDRDGKVARHWPKVSVKGHAAEVVDAVRALTGAPPAEVAPPPSEQAATAKKSAPKKPGAPKRAEAATRKPKLAGRKAPAKAAARKKPAPKATKVVKKATRRKPAKRR